MILTFQVPSLASEQGLCYIDRVQLGFPQKKIQKNGESWYGGIRPIRKMAKLELSI